MPPGQHGLRLGITPYLTKAELVAQMSPIAADVSATTGVPVEVVIAETYEDLVKSIVAGTVDVALLSPLSYVMARQRDPGLQLLARTLSYGTTDYSSYIIVRASDPAEDLTGLKGRDIAWVDVLSASGYLFPYAAFLKQHVDPATDLHVIWAGTHTAALRAVIEGRVAAAAISSGTLAEDRTGGAGDIKILHKAGRIPYDALCARTGLPAGGVRKLAAAFQGLDTRRRHGREVLARAIGISGWIAAQDSDYDQVRTVLTEVEAHTRRPARTP
jgi:phosphonate transport system substrate-binding protein